ncbi:hypothetical protein K8354_15380 [Polaribacter litorisediminis]|uniref:hypothetical protein n=1 Tax=Polaribacter litorisediminis TaxID=1908341 RepID=UPI001CBECA1D|nr:hypothetical protein [Polaribacter litorisediminis]UAM97665.1 hypothetical protein K8354_15380 [Polaribacter litorisediminis]
MEKRYEITEKQLNFLEDFLDRKYPQVNEEVRVELIDHLVSDFEETSENGNLSQYLSNELGFIRRFTDSRVQLVQVDYDKKVWVQYFSFFTNIKRIPITLFTFLLMYFLSENLSNEVIWLCFFFSVLFIYGFSLFTSTIKPKKLRKFKEVQFLGTGLGFGIPYMMVMIPLVIENRDFISDYSFVFSLYWFFAFSLSIASLIAMFKEKKIILEKYKHLLN